MRGTAAEAAAYEGEVDQRLAAKRKPAPGSREAAQAECDRANKPIDDSRILALASLDINRRSAADKVRAQQREPVPADATPIVMTCPRLDALAGLPADKTLPAGTVPEVGPLVLLDLRDGSGDRLRVEPDGRDGKGFVVLGEPDDERVFEVRSRVHRDALCGAIGRLAMGGDNPKGEPLTGAVDVLAKHFAAVQAGDPDAIALDAEVNKVLEGRTLDEAIAVTRGVIAEERERAGQGLDERTNGRPMSLEDTAKASALAALMSAAGPLDVDDLRALTWIASLLPFERLLATCRGLDDERREPALLPDGTLPRNTLTCDGRDHERFTHATVLGALRDVRRLILPHDAATCSCAPCARRRAGT